MSRLFHLSGSARPHPDVEQWFVRHDEAPGQLAREWFGHLRDCGEDVTEVLHDGQPTACIDGAAFAYVDAFTAHANLGFFHGAELPDPAGLLQGSGRYMRHVKLRPGEKPDRDALRTLVRAAYLDAKRRTT